MRPPGARSSLWAAALLLLVTCSGSPEPSPVTPPRAEVPDCGRWDPIVEVGPVGAGDDAIDEVSGLAESRIGPGVLWAILDNGNPASLYAIGQDGRALGTFTLPSKDSRGEPVENIDWEDVAVSGSEQDATVWIADVGTFPIERDTVDLYGVVEPAVDPQGQRVEETLAPDDVTKVRLSYPEGVTVENAEALFVDPVTGDAFIVSKGLAEGDEVSVWKASASVLARGGGVLEEVARVTGRIDDRLAYGPTSADISPDGNWIVMKRLDEVFMWPRMGTIEETFTAQPTAPCSSLDPGSAPNGDDGESIAFDLGPGGAVAGAWTTLDRPDDPNPPLHHSGCEGDPCLEPPS